jgi:hypothetical protein
VPAPSHLYKDTGTQYTPLGFPPTVRDDPGKLAREVGYKKKPDVQMGEPDGEEPDEADRRLLSANSTIAAASAEVSIRDEELAFRPPENSRSDMSLSNIVAALPSSPEKLRHNRQRIKAMPKDYMKSNPIELGAVIADMLVELIQINDEVLPKAGKLTRFHSK